jgi:hypothetical protein
MSPRPDPRAAGQGPTTDPPRERGQATVELVALLPLLITLMLALFTLLAAGRAHEEAGAAAEAGVVALLNDRDPHAAACTALGRSPRCRRGVQVRGRTVTVRVRPKGPFPPLNRTLQATETAKAGP